MHKFFLYSFEEELLKDTTQFYLYLDELFDKYYFSVSHLNTEKYSHFKTFRYQYSRLISYFTERFYSYTFQLTVIFSLCISRERSGPFCVHPISYFRFFIILISILIKLRDMNPLKLLTSKFIDLKNVVRFSVTANKTLHLTIMKLN